MNTIGASSDNADSSDWQRFMDLLEGDSKIKTEAQPHYGRWASDWLKAGGKASESATRDYFDELGRRRNLKDWQKDRGTEVFWTERSVARRARRRAEPPSQYIQAVFAVELWAKKVTQLKWAHSFDWSGLAAQAVELEDTHRTLYRETQAVSSRTTKNQLRVPGPSSRDRITAPGEKEAIAELYMESQKAIRLAGLAVATEKAYLLWIVRFSKFRIRRLEQGIREFEPESLSLYLEYLALEKQVAPSTQKQALNALVLLGKKVHGVKEFELDFKPAWKGHRRPPTIMTREEVKRVIGFLNDPWKLISQILYGSGLRQSEGLRLRVKDIDFGQGTIAVHDGKGGKHRMVPLPKALEQRLQEHLQVIREKHLADLAIGVGEVHLTESLRRKYPNAAKEWPWQKDRGTEVFWTERSEARRARCWVEASSQFVFSHRPNSVSIREQNMWLVITYTKILWEGR